MRRNIIDLVGKKFGKLTVIKFSHSNNGAFWVCECECGNIIIRSGGNLRANLRAGFDSNCGCEFGNTQHGMMGTAIHSMWSNMKQRCNNKNHKDYKWYGARGITYDPNWEKFENFYNDIKDIYENFCKNNPNKKASLDRINVNGNYEISNVQIISLENQNRNKRSNKVNMNIVQEIRDKFKTGKYSKIELAIEYNLSETFTGKIINNKVWN